MVGVGERLRRRLGSGGKRARGNVFGLDQHKKHRTNSGRGHRGEQRVNDRSAENRPRALRAESGERAYHHKQNGGHCQQLEQPRENGGHKIGNGVNGAHAQNA